jgi:hypothetical protein
MDADFIVYCSLLVLPQSTFASPISTGPSIHITDATGRTGLLWGSIGLAILTSLLQGLITTFVTIAEDQSMWTFRFRIARYEHHYWTGIAFFLSTSFALIVLSFLSGNNNDSLSVLALSTATALAIVRYAIPAWRNRHYIENRWLSWTGPSRTAIDLGYASVCGDEKRWTKIANIRSSQRIIAAPSDEWGWAIRPPPGLWQDPTALLSKIGENKSDFAYASQYFIGPCVFDDGLHPTTDTASLLWGERQGFRRRASRAVNSMPLGLLKSRPFTVDGYNGEGLCLAMGILGRNKGLAPRTLVFDSDDTLKKMRKISRAAHPVGLTTELEGTSIWRPRPNKVMRSYYLKAMTEQFGILGKPYVAAATELALIFLDCTERGARDWLSYGLEQQSMDVNQRMSRPLDDPVMKATNEQLQTLYRASYTSMLLSLNYFPTSSIQAQSRVETTLPVRPDLICFALLYLAEHAVRMDGPVPKEGVGADRPHWWEQEWVQARLNTESRSLTGSWQKAASWALGLRDWPAELLQWPKWPDVRYQPTDDAGSAS